MSERRRERRSRGRMRETWKEGSNPDNRPALHSPMLVSVHTGHSGESCIAWCIAEYPWVSALPSTCRVMCSYTDPDKMF